ncbi:hypothetical protein [Jannaschia sp. R86511]|uniref:hypothetical protein n=1 Tax=Jannaschia sp. R86511 TaxID=3093853 RepID=UPI0036D36099
MSDTQFWFNTETKQVEQGPQSHYTNRMGPYPTAEAASRALETAAARSEAWDDEDEKWDKGGAQG